MENEYNYKGAIVLMDKIPHKDSHRFKPCYKSLPKNAAVVREYLKLGRLVLKLPSILLHGKLDTDAVYFHLGETLESFISKYFEMSCMEFFYKICFPRGNNKGNFTSNDEVVRRLFSANKLMFVGYTGEFETVDMDLKEFDDRYKLHDKKFTNILAIEAFLPKAKEAMAAVLEEIAENEAVEAEMEMIKIEAEYKSKLNKLAPKVKDKAKKPTKPKTEAPVEKALTEETKS